MKNASPKGGLASEANSRDLDSLCISAPTDCPATHRRRAIPQFLDHDRPAEPLDILRIRAEARAYLFAIGSLDLHEAVDALEQYAHQSGLVRRLGQDLVQEVIALAFQPYRGEAADAR
jgi:hypothetical protein